MYYLEGKGRVVAVDIAPITKPINLLRHLALLGGQFVSRVNLKLREEKGYTYGARTGFDWRRGPTPFVLAGALALLIALGTIAGHAFKVARANPIHALRYE